MITIIAAMDEDRLIGRGKELPWRLPEEMKHFQRTTSGSAVIFGRVTWESMTTTRPFLDGRINFVVTRRPSQWRGKVAESGFDPTFGPHFVDTIELAITRARREFPEYVETIYLAGGRQLYELALRRNLVDRMIISHVKGKHIGDVYFPPIGPEWTPRTLFESDTFDIIDYSRKV
ncbi:MAG: dihydrofolate reductase [Phycisphaerae bacterium]|nr:dihydrofolate reductase [Phycisphaerae bacterium]